MNGRLLIAVVMLPALLLADDIKTISGKEYKGVTVTRVEPDGLVVTTADGVERIPFADLGADLRLKFGYNAAIAAAATAKEKQALAESQDPALLERRKQAENLALMRKLACPNCSFKITQITDEGMLVYGPVGADGRWKDCFIYGKTSFDVADGNSYEGVTVYPCGRFQFTTVMGAARTLQAFALTPETALAIFQKEIRAEKAAGQ